MLDNDRNEQWLPVVGYEGIYSVSDMGRVRRDGKFYGCRDGTVLKGEKKRDGYIRVMLCDGNRNWNRQPVHRLVAESFIAACPDGHQCNHKNGVKCDNRVENLEWVTASGNRRHALDVLKVNVSRGEDRWSSKLTESDVRKIRELAASKEKSYLEIANQFGIHRGHVSLIHLRKRWAWLS